MKSSLITDVSEEIMPPKYFYKTIKPNNNKYYKKNAMEGPTQIGSQLPNSSIKSTQHGFYSIDETTTKNNISSSNNNLKVENAFAE